MELPPAVLAHVSKAYGAGERRIVALDDACLEVRRGDLIIVTGRSGSGKSTLLAILGALSRPTAGEVNLFGQPVAGLDDAARSALRAERLGFVFQFSGLLPTLTVYDNVRLPSLFRPGTDSRLDLRARDLLRQVGLGHRLASYPTELSGGEQRRVAIARSLLGEPDLLLADEPTGDLDSETEAEVMAILTDLHAAGLTIVLVTHNLDLRRHATRWLRMTDGRLAEEGL